MRILHNSTYSVQPWKNGGGATTEIIVSPPGANFDTFDWRISMAQVATPGPFSQFPGIDRSLALLEGDGIILDVAGRGRIELRPGDYPAVFPGDASVAARLPGGPILDLNVMTRRGRYRHFLSRVQVATGEFELRQHANVTVAVVRGAGCMVDDQRLGDGDAVILDGRASAAMSFDGPCGLWIADLWSA